MHKITSSLNFRPLKEFNLWYLLHYAHIVRIYNKQGVTANLYVQQQRSAETKATRENTCRGCEFSATTDIELGKFGIRNRGELNTNSCAPLTVYSPRRGLLLVAIVRALLMVRIGRRWG